MELKLGGTVGRTHGEVKENLNRVPKKGEEAKLDLSIIQTKAKF